MTGNNGSSITNGVSGSRTDGNNDFVQAVIEALMSVGEQIGLD